MDSKPKADVVGLPRAEMPEIRFDDGDIRRTNRWLIGAVVVLALAVVALGAALIVQAGSEETPTKATPATPPAVGLADPAAVALVDGFLAAHNTNDADTVEQQFVADAVFTSVDAEGRSTPYEGRDAVWSAYNELFAAIPDLRVERVSPILQFGDVTSFTLRDSNQTEMMWVLVWRDGKIAEQWNVFHDDHPVEAG